MKIGTFTENLLIAFVIALYDGGLAVVINPDGRPGICALELDEIIDIRGVGDLGHSVDILAGVLCFSRLMR